MERLAAPNIVTTALARVDRRALPEAWYAALHLAHDAPPAPARHHAAAATAAEVRAPRAASPRRAGTACTSATTSAPSRAAQSLRTATPERRSVIGTLARKLEHGIARAATRRCGSAFTLTLAEGRVRVVVCHVAGRTSVVALCAPVLRERVERALAHARFALAARGVRTDAA